MIETLDLERQILYAMMQEPSYITADSRIYRGLFIHPDCRGLYDALQEMCAQGRWSGEPADEILLADTSGVSVAKIESLISGCYLPRSIAAFREWVGRLTSRVKTKRAFDILMRETDALAKTGEADPSELRQAQALLAEAVDTGQPAAPVAIPFVGEAKDDLLADLIGRQASELKGINLKSQPKLTRATSGLHGIVGLCGKPKKGKSTWTLQVAGDAADEGYNVLFMDFETGPRNLRWRDFSRRTGISETDLLDMDESDLRAKVDQYNPGHLVFLRDHGIDRVKIQRYINNVRDVTGELRTLLIFDSLQKLPFKKIQDRRHEIDAWLRVFEEVKADDQNLTLLFTSELSREGGQPKESGDIEYTCDLLLELYGEDADSVKTRWSDGREESFEIPDNGKRFLKIKLARDCEIPTQAFSLDFDFQHWTFMER